MQRTAISNRKKLEKLIVNNTHRKKRKYMYHHAIIICGDGNFVVLRAKQTKQSKNKQK